MRELTVATVRRRRLPSRNAMLFALAVIAFWWFLFGDTALW
jgi:hypothetical protein